MEKLERLNQLTVDMVRELGVVGLEIQIATNGLIIANNIASSKKLSDIEAKMESLQNSFQHLTISVHQAHSVRMEGSASQIATSQEGGISRQNDGVVGGSPASTSSSSSIAGSTLTRQVFTPPEDERLSQARIEQSCRYLAGSLNAGRIPVPAMVSTSTHPSRKLEFRLVAIRTFYTVGNFDASRTEKRAQFWEDAKLAIPLTKVSEGKVLGASRSQTRGSRLLKALTADASNSLIQGIATIIIELLSTISTITDLSICFDIVGQQLDVPKPDPMYHNECAVYTMEDIAKTFECTGNLEQAVAWLKQAGMSGCMVWGRSEALAHIQDKTHELLKEMGKDDELRIWNESLSVEVSDHAEAELV
ncbi:MAG: hypothetical protein Q9163_001656 [Psora crenata]